LIVRSFSDEQGKFIGKAEYLRRIRLSGLNVEEYENDRRNDITARKVRDFIISPTQVSDREVEEKYKNDNTKVVAADIRHPAQILDDPELLGLIELNRPVAVIASAILHHLLDEDDPIGVIRAFTAVTPPGSCLFVSHFRTLADPESAALEAVMLQAFGRGVWRTDEQIAEYFAGLRPVEPGIAACAQWRPDADPGELTSYQRLIAAGLGVK